ncbi:MAG: gamma-glutamyl-gamma-aminobutyrate hydrolase family protein [Candidatus Pacebacteria bacterium]|nr:gamma-glutamyl-gamma-aminobutyrate hydrolase family protein [Candidatus Paceibacterota bacterium]
MKTIITQKMVLDKHNIVLDALEQTYSKYFSVFGLNLIPIPNTLESVEDYLISSGAERIIISGGNSIMLNFREKTKDLNGIDTRDRDNTEANIIKYAINKNIPVLGICRGAQFINTYFGGGVLRDLKNYLNGSVEHVATKHKISISNIITARIKVSDQYIVNSYHDDGFTRKELSSELIDFAVAQDGIIEGFYHKSKPIMGVMWHPERDGVGLSCFSRDLINIFINNEFNYAQGKHSYKRK